MFCFNIWLYWEESVAFPCWKQKEYPAIYSVKSLFCLVTLSCWQISTEQYKYVIFVIKTRIKQDWNANKCWFVYDIHSISRYIWNEVLFMVLLIIYISDILSNSLYICWLFFLAMILAGVLNDQIFNCDLNACNLW